MRTAEQRYNMIVALVNDARRHGLSSIDLAALEKIIFDKERSKDETARR